MKTLDALLEAPDPAFDALESPELDEETWEAAWTVLEAARAALAVAATHEIRFTFASL